MLRDEIDICKSLTKRLLILRNIIIPHDRWRMLIVCYPYCPQLHGLVLRLLGKGVWNFSTGPDPMLVAEPYL